MSRYSGSGSISLKPTSKSVQTMASSIDLSKTYYDRKLEISVPDLMEDDSISFRLWHRMLNDAHEHSIEENEGSFNEWTWCSFCCSFCRWFDNVDYNEYACRWCCRFKKIKACITFVLIGLFSYAILYDFFEDDILPGGTLFYIGLMYLLSLIAGTFLIWHNLPPFLGMLVVGVIFGNIPREFLPSYDEEEYFKVSEYFENGILVVALIRAGLLMDMKRIKGRVIFILALSLCPMLSEFLLLTITSHYFLNLSWEWSTLQGSILCPVSFSTVISCMEKLRVHGLGEDKHLSTVLCASAALEITIGLYIYSTCITLIFAAGTPQRPSWKDMTIDITLQLFIGLASGLLLGLLAAFFPDRRTKEAPLYRIVFVGTASFAAFKLFGWFDFLGAGVVTTIFLCTVANNMWEQLGWNKSSNPVIYFYALMYFISQPMLLSMVGCQLRFLAMNSSETGIMLAIIVCGVIARETVCFFVLNNAKSFPTTLKEKLFICIAWLPKGALEALMANLLEHLIRVHGHDIENYETYKKSAVQVSRMSVLAIFVTAPLGYYGMSFAGPHLLSKAEKQMIFENTEREIPEIGK